TVRGYASNRLRPLSVITWTRYSLHVWRRAQGGHPLKGSHHALPAKWTAFATNACAEVVDPVVGPPLLRRNRVRGRSDRGSRRSRPRKHLAEPSRRLGWR